MDDFYDVVLAGAGPTGCTAALYAHKHGLKVLVIDKNQFPRDKICGDGFMPLYKAIFNELNIDLNSLQANSYHKSTQADIYCNEDSITIPVDILLCPRRAFDDFLFNITQSRLQVLQHAALKEIIFNPQDNIVTIDLNGISKEVKCKYVIGADGASSLVRRLSNVPKPKEYAVASRSYYFVENIKADLLIKYTNEIASGYHWQFKVSENIINTGVILFDLNNQANLSKLHKKYTEELNSIGKEIDAMKTWQLPFINSLDELSGNGYLLVGDAGGLIDPLLGHGIDTGMLSGKLASHSIFKNYDNRLKTSEEYKSLVERKIYVKWSKSYDFRNNIKKYVNDNNQLFLNKFTEHLQQGFIDYTL